MADVEDVDDDDDTSELLLFFLHEDGQGNVTHVTTPAGDVAESYEYDAVGNMGVKDASGNPLTESAIGNDCTRRGDRYGALTGLNLSSGGHAYDPKTGRRLQLKVIVDDPAPADPSVDGGNGNGGATAPILFFGWLMGGSIGDWMDNWNRNQARNFWFRMLLAHDLADQAYWDGFLGPIHKSWRSLPLRGGREAHLRSVVGYGRCRTKRQISRFVAVVPDRWPSSTISGGSFLVQFPRMGRALQSHGATPRVPGRRS